MGPRQHGPAHDPPGGPAAPGRPRRPLVRAGVAAARRHAGLPPPRVATAARAGGGLPPGLLRVGPLPLLRSRHQPHRAADGPGAAQRRRQGRHLPPAGRVAAGPHGELLLLRLSHGRDAGRDHGDCDAGGVQPRHGPGPGAGGCRPPGAGGDAGYAMRSGAGHRPALRAGGRCPPWADGKHGGRPGVRPRPGPGFPRFLGGPGHQGTGDRRRTDLLVPAGGLVVVARQQGHRYRGERSEPGLHHPGVPPLQLHAGRPAPAHDVDALPPAHPGPGPSALGDARPLSPRVVSRPVGFAPRDRARAGGPGGHQRLGPARVHGPGDGPGGRQGVPGLAFSGRAASGGRRGGTRSGPGGRRGGRLPPLLPRSGGVAPRHSPGGGADNAATPLSHRVGSVPRGAGPLHRPPGRVSVARPLSAATRSVRGAGRCALRRLGGRRGGPGQPRRRWFHASSTYFQA